MNTDITSKLDNARRLLDDLGNGLSDLIYSSADVFGDEAIQKRRQEFWATYREAVERLKTPNFRIATIGTTSSGKSTIVNALMGRRVAPIESGEMSAGVLSLQHSLDRRLVIEATPGAIWETGEWTDLSDEDFYRRIQQVMHAYHQARQKKEYVAPQVKAYVPLLPACDSSLLALPEGVGVEFLDLPGLKSVQDRANLEVIQQQVSKAFSLVALDYGQVDEQQRQRLLGELKQVVEYMGGRTESMIFILNRVDQRGADDLPLEQRLEKLQGEIQEALGLPELPDVIPFKARLLYYAQCAWGTNPLSTSSSISPEERTELLKKMFLDCAAVFEEKSMEDEDLELWLLKLKKDLRRGTPIDDEKTRKIMRYAFEWSGGEKLWSCFRERLRESFAELVLMPALFQLFNSFDALADNVDVLIETGKINNQEQVRVERAKIGKVRENLSRKVKEVGDSLKKETKKYIDALKSNDVKKRNEIQQDAEKKGRKGFSLIFKAVSDVEADLTKNLIATLRDAFQKNQPAFELRDKLQQVIPPPIAEDIARQYDNVGRRLDKFTKAEKGDWLTKKVRADDEKAKKELEHDERYVRLLYHTMSQAITTRAEFSLQAKAKSFKEALESLVKELISKLESCLGEQEFSSVSWQKAAMSDLRKKLGEKDLKLPEKFFELPAAIEQKRQTQTEVVGTKTEYENQKRTKYQSYTETYEEGSCFTREKTRTRQRPVEYTERVAVKRDIKEDVEYVELSLPNPQLMAKQWSQGIAKGKDALWEILQNWIVDKLDEVRDFFEKSANEIIDLADRALENQLQVIESNFEENQKFWDDFAVKKEALTAVKNELEEEVKKN